MPPMMSLLGIRSSMPTANGTVRHAVSAQRRSKIAARELPNAEPQWGEAVNKAKEINI